MTALCASSRRRASPGCSVGWSVGCSVWWSTAAVFSSNRATLRPAAAAASAAFTPAGPPPGTMTSKSVVIAGLRCFLNAHSIRDGGPAREYAAAVDHDQALLARPHQAEHAARRALTRTRTQGLRTRREQGGRHAFAGARRRRLAVEEKPDGSGAAWIVDAHGLVIQHETASLDN